MTAAAEAARDLAGGVAKASPPAVFAEMGEKTSTRSPPLSAPPPSAGDTAVRSRSRSGLSRRARVPVYLGAFADFPRQSATAKPA